MKISESVIAIANAIWEKPQDDNHRIPSIAARVRFQVWLCEIFGGKVNLRPVFTVGYPPTNCYTFINGPDTDFL
jgi:hypothetical protein